MSASPGSAHLDGADGRFGWADRVSAETHHVPVEAVLAGDSPRLGGEDLDHIQVMAMLDELPPILVHHTTMRVVDGMHRLRAAQMSGAPTIAVRFFEGSLDDAFIAAVDENTTHGLPLTLADRQAAAERIVTSHPEHSDRAIATIAGLSPHTVGVIRQRVRFGVTVDLSARRGRDGKLRPLSSAEGRRIASEVLRRRPEASLREVARVAGISPATVRDVRNRISRGDDPVPSRQRGSSTDRIRAAARAEASRHTRDCAVLLENLSRDPSLRFNEAGRRVLRWLFSRARGVDGYEEVLPALPEHCAFVVAELARGCAQEWLELAAKLDGRPAAGEPATVTAIPRSTAHATQLSTA